MRKILSPQYHYAGVYMIENKTNGKVYIGSSYDIEDRLDCHRSALKRGVHHCKALQEDFDNHHQIVTHVLHVEAVPRNNSGVKRNRLFALEWKFIEQYGAIDRGYNQLGTSDVVKNAL